TPGPAPGGFGQPQYPLPGPQPPLNGIGPPPMGGLAPLGPVPPAYRPRLMREYSWIYIDSPPPRLLKVHDIITVIVDEKSEVTEQSTFNRQKNGIFKAELKNFIRIDNAGNLNNAAENDPKIDSLLQATLNSRGQLQQREGVKYRIAATVVDVLP